jgi:hypothetical protein
MLTLLVLRSISHSDAVAKSERMEPSVKQLSRRNYHVFCETPVYGRNVFTVFCANRHRLIYWLVVHSNQLSNMGKRGKRGGGARFYRNKKSRGENTSNDSWRQDKKGEDNYTDFVFTNENFIKYYQAQGVVDAAEWEEFMKFLAKPLPTSFRINNSCAFADRYVPAYAATSML